FDRGSGGVRRNRRRGREPEPPEQGHPGDAAREGRHRGLAPRLRPPNGRLPRLSFPRMPFELVSPFAPAGDQPRAIRELTTGLARGERYQTLLGVTGSGKTMTMAHVVASFGRPTLVLSHNKTLAAHLDDEPKEFRPKHAVHS